MVLFDLLKKLLQLIENPRKINPLNLLVKLFLIKSIINKYFFILQLFLSNQMFYQKFTEM